MSDYFRRNIEVIIDRGKWTYPNLYMDFDVKFDYDSIPDEADISLYNLSKNSIASINSGARIIVNAGYGKDIGTILDGVIQSGNVEKSGTDKVLKIKALNVTSQYLNTSIAYTYGPGASSEYIIRDVLGYAGITPNVVQLEKPKVYKNGYQAVGKVIDVVRNVAKDAISKVVIKNSNITIITNNGTEDAGYLLNAENGLISVEPISENDNPAKYKIVTMLNHGIAPYTVVDVKSDTWTGVGVVSTGEHNSSDFTTEMEVIPV